MIGLRRATATVGAERGTGSVAAPARQRRTGRSPDAGGQGTAALLCIVLIVAVGLAAWMPWRQAERPMLSDYTPRISLPAPTAEAVAATPQPATASTPAVAPTSADASRPLGLPLQRGDWVIIRDYADHNGPGPNGAIDIGVQGDRDAVGTPVYATHEGQVRVLRNNRLYGNLVAVKGERWSTTYGHLDQVLVSDGQLVKRGDQIGTMGMTGRAATPHVDYQVWEKVDGRELNRNPMDFIEAR